MALQWLKKKVKGNEAKKENSKVNDRLQKLISDIKSKRDSFASVQTGFPSSVASLVTNTWMPSHEGDDIPLKKKKKRWPYSKKKGESCKESDLNKAESLPLDEVSDLSFHSESVGQLEATPQPGDAISEQISNDPQIVGQFRNYPELVGHFANNPQILGHFGNDPENLGDSEKDSHFGNQFGNDPQLKGQVSIESQSVCPLGSELKPISEFGLEAQCLGVNQSPQDQIVKEISSVGQLDSCDQFPRGQARLCPWCRELLAIVVLLAVFISVVLDAKMAAVGVTVIVYFLLRFFYGKQESLSRSSILSIFSCVWKEFRSLFGEMIGNLSFLKCKKGLRSDEGLPLKEASNCCVLPSLFERIKGVLLKTGIYMSVAKERKLSSTLASSLWIIVLVGLIAGRFTAFILTLAWCLFVKLVQIAEQKQQTNLD